MTRQQYLLITRSSLLLIVFLLAAPVVDFWRFGRFVPTGGGVLPIGAILPAGRDVAADPSDAPQQADEPKATADAKRVGDPKQTAGPKPAPESTSPTRAASFAPPAPTAATGRGAGRSAAPVAARPAYEAWTAWGQVDPFWDGYDRPARGSAPAASQIPPSDPEPAPTGADSVTAPAAPSAPGPGRPIASRPRPSRDPGSLREDEPIVETAAADDEVEGTPEDDRDQVEPGPDGWIIGEAPAAATGSEGGRLTPDPSPPPGPIGGNIGPPSSLPREPKPRPVVSPTAHLDAPAASVGIGESFDVVVRVDSVEQMTSLPFHLKFEPGLLAFVSAQAGPALGALQPVLLASVNPNRPGDLAVGLSLIEASGSFSGGGNLIILRFQAIASGRSDLTWSQATLRGPASEPVEARFTGGSVLVR